MVTDSWSACNELKPNAIEDCVERLMQVKSVEALHRVWKLEEGMPAQVSSLFLNHGLKLRKLVGKNCHSVPKEPQEDINGNHDESPSQPWVLRCMN
ncbi:hypothetical protein TNCV_808981 [Trichonephila clavipes]|nr:hypothetical protein TNCV_808981 [Trichonephila clavipes]